MSVEEFGAECNTAVCRYSLFASQRVMRYSFVLTDAGWSSLAARRAHNPKVTGSNPVPATKQINGLPSGKPFLFVVSICMCAPCGLFPSTFHVNSCLFRGTHHCLAPGHTIGIVRMPPPNQSPPAVTLSVIQSSDGISDSLAALLKPDLL